MEIEKMKLSERAKVLLALVVESTTEEGQSFVPRERPGNWCRWTETHVMLSGASDASILRSLDKKGLIKLRATTGLYAYWARATEDGQLYYTRVMETTESSLRRAPAEEQGD